MRICFVWPGWSEKLPNSRAMAGGPVNTPTIARTKAKTEKRKRRPMTDRLGGRYFYGAMIAPRRLDWSSFSQGTAMSDRSIAIQPVAGTLGAEIVGVDLAEPLGNSAAAAIRRAFTDHLVLFFRDQRLTPEQHLAFSRLFGPLSRMPYVKAMDGYPDIIAVLKEADERKISTFGNAWHSDFSFLEEPPLGSVLYAREVPSHGGDTLWAN